MGSPLSPIVTDMRDLEEIAIGKLPVRLFLFLNMFLFLNIYK